MAKDRVTAAMENNRKVFMENGPRMSSRYQTWVKARDRKRNRVLVGGLGCMGCGAMWIEDKDGEYRDHPGYEDAPEKDSWGDFGTPESWDELGGK